LFKAVIAQKIPVGEHVDFVFMLENVSVSWREQAVRHRIGAKVVDERIGIDIIPELAESSFWSQCFVGGTKVKLLDGTTKTMKELAEAGGEFWVYSISKNGRIVPGKAHSARKTKVADDLVGIELDNGRMEICTSDHLWMIRDGQYVEAGDLKPGQSLMPLYTEVDEWGYERCADPKIGKYVLTHAMVDRHFNGKLGQNQVVHHASFNQLNNSPDWLVRMDKKEHIAMHGRATVERMRSDPETHSKALSAGQKKYWDGLDEEEKTAHYAQLAQARGAIDVAKRDAAAKKGMDERWANKFWQEKMLPILSKNGAKGIGRKLSLETKKKMRVAARERYNRQKAANELPDGFNHKVVEVRHLERSEYVYDITVDEHHNFALDSGVFVHNSMRIQNMGQFATKQKYRLPETVKAAGSQAIDAYHETMLAIEGTYNELVALGVPMEDARELIPLGAQHRISWRLNIGALQHIVGKRGCWILQLGVWGPVIMGMIEELASKIDPIFRDLVKPPCIGDDDGFKACIYMEECRRRIDESDQLLPCPLHFFKHEIGIDPIDESAAIDKANEANLYMRVDMFARAQSYMKFWGRNPYTGKKIK
jgi:hypothetical protein